MHPGGYPSFTLGDVDFDVVVPAWLTLCENAPTACSVLFGLKYISQGYASTRLLSAASAAEALHRSLHDSPPYRDTDFNDLLEKVLASNAGKMPPRRPPASLSGNVSPTT